MHTLISYFRTVVHTALSLYFKQESTYATLRDIPLPDEDDFRLLLTSKLDFEERIVLLLALMPHISPESLDFFLMKNATTDRPYTEFGGWAGTIHKGFLPTGETAAFLLTLENAETRPDVIKLFSKDHRFFTENILRLESAAPGEPFLSGKLVVHNEFLEMLFGYSGNGSNNAVKKITTPLEWSDFITSQEVREELEAVIGLTAFVPDIIKRSTLEKHLKPGHRAVFYGPTGTGKTLAACLIGKAIASDVYRIDVAALSSASIDETITNLLAILEWAANKRAILLLSDADDFFGQSRNSFLLRHIQDYPGLVIVTASTEELPHALKQGFETVIRFRMPNEQQRYKLWESMAGPMLPEEGREKTLAGAADHELSAGSIANVLRRSILHMQNEAAKTITPALLEKEINREHSRLNLR